MKTILSLAAIAASFACAPALAEAPATPQAVTVSYADLDLGSEPGLRELDRRIGLAVREACGTASDVDLHGKNLVVRCRAETLRTAARQKEAAIASLRSASANRLAAR